MRFQGYFITTIFVFQCCNEKLGIQIIPPESYLIQAVLLNLMEIKMRYLYAH